MQRIRAIFTLYFFGAVLAAQTAAADEMPSPVPVPADTASLPAAADQQEGASEAIVEPLEIWIPRAARTPVKAATVSPTAAKTVEPTLSPEEREAAEERALLEELLKRRQPKQEHLDDAVPVENRIVLDRTHKRRLAHAAKRRGQVIRKQQRFLRKLQVKQTRGPREVRLCSLNVELFRPLASRKGVREKAWKLYKRRERAYVRAITQNHCTVVAIQRLYGSNYSDAASGIQILARSLERATKSRWEGRAGGTAKGFEHNAFLVQMHNVSIQSSRSYADYPVAGENPAEPVFFFSAPLEMRIRVRRAADESWQELLLFSASFAQGAGRKPVEAESFRMQMAETLRRLVKQRMQELEKQGGGISAVLIDRASGRFWPSSLVLEGRRRLADFLEGGKCRVHEIAAAVPEPMPQTKQKQSTPSRSSAYGFSADCGEAPWRPKIFFGLASESVNAPAKKDRLIMGGNDKEKAEPLLALSKETPKEKNKRTAEIYLAAKDLHYARASEHSFVRYAVRVVRLKSGKKTAPLVTADLNW